MPYTPEMLVDQDTGAIDWTVLKHRALAQAQRAFGGPNPPPAYIRDELNSLKQMANVMRRRWRAARNLPDDTAYVMTAIPAWGASGDSFGRGA